MLDQLNGATRVHYIVGDPIAQVRSPAGVTQAFVEQGHNAIVIPAQVSSNDLSRWLAGVSLARNVDGIIVTVPHKFSCYELCSTSSERAGFLRAVNTMRRNADGSWHGDMFDGLGYVAAMRQKGCEPAGKRALLVGAGGAGTAIAHALLSAGVGELAIHDADPVRRDSLVQRLQTLGLGRVSVGTDNPRGFDIALNATPMGMQDGDPLPIDASHFSPAMLVGCVVTLPAVPPMIERARATGCQTITGTDMFAQVRALMVGFLLAEGACRP